MKIVAVAGGFDPFHEGHLEHIYQASLLGDIVYVLINQDEDLIRKKGYCFSPLWFRASVVTAVMREWGIKGGTETIVDNDGTCAKTLKIWYPNIFAKGGDRTPENMPLNEIEACKEIGCEIVYGVGRKLNSSSNIVWRG